MIESSSFSRRLACYCGDKEPTSLDHLLPKRRGGLDVADNIVWACRTCNSSKGSTDVLQWHRRRNVFPPLLLLRRYLKLSMQFARDEKLINVPVARAAALHLPFDVAALPHTFPAPTELRLWVKS